MRLGENIYTDWNIRACVYESMRILGPLGMGLQRVVPAQGLELGGREFAAGTVLSVHVP